MSSYHLEAGIAYWHCIKADSDEKWKAILRLYDQLLLINYSPSVALNRLFAFNKVFGPRPALVEAEKMRLENNHFYFTLLGQLYSGIDREAAEVNFRKAIALAKTEADRQILRQKIERLKD